MWSFPHLLAFRTRKDPKEGPLWEGLELASRVGGRSPREAGGGGQAVTPAAPHGLIFCTGHSKLHLQRGWASLWDHRRIVNTTPPFEEAHTMDSACKESGVFHR